MVGCVFSYAGQSSGGRDGGSFPPPVIPCTAIAADDFPGHCVDSCVSQAHEITYPGLNVTAQGAKVAIVVPVSASRHARVTRLDSCQRGRIIRSPADRPHRQLCEPARRRQMAVLVRHADRPPGSIHRVRAVLERLLADVKERSFISLRSAEHCIEG